MFKLLKLLRSKVARLLFTINWKSANFYRQKKQYFVNKFGESLADYYDRRGYDRSGRKKSPPHFPKVEKNSALIFRGPEELISNYPHGKKLE